MGPVKDEQSDLAYIYGQVGHGVKLLKYLKENNIVPKNIELKLGIYVAIPEYAKPAFHLIRKELPETEITIMPGHHSMVVNKNAPTSIITNEDWDHSMVYSWIEFDGMMFLQQNGISGIRDIVKQAVDNSSDHRGTAILYNHWRTAENKVTARYAAVSALYGPVDPIGFYKDYAKSYGIEDVNDFATAMADLNEADLTGMRNVRGIGFCWMGRWRNGGNVAGQNVEKLQTTRKSYAKVLDDLKKCAANTKRKEGRELIAFLDNRIRTTIIYMKVFEKASALNPLQKKKSLTEQEKKEYVRISNETLALLEQYINIYATMNADRGCSGNLVSFWYGPVRATKFLREKFGGVPFNDVVPKGTSVDAPPLPIINPDK